MFRIFCYGFCDYLIKCPSGFRSILVIEFFRIEFDGICRIRKNSNVLFILSYRSGTVNSNTVNSKFHLIRSYYEIFFYHFPNIPCLKYTVNSNFHLIRGKTLPTNDLELTVPDLYCSASCCGFCVHLDANFQQNFRAILVIEFFRIEFYGIYRIRKNSNVSVHIAILIHDYL